MVEAPAIIEKPKVEIDPELLQELNAVVQEEGQVIVHCLYLGIGWEAIRIWPTTFLMDKNSDHSSKLVTVEKITLAPQWQWCRFGPNRFTLIFSGLPRHCEQFDLVEQCEGDGAFVVKDIVRNAQDVYYIRIDSGIQFE